MRRMIGAGAIPQIPRLVGLRLFGVADKTQSFIGNIFRKVISLLRLVGLIDEMVVFDEVWIPIVGLTTVEAIEAIVALPERPILLGGAHRELVDWRGVVLAHPERTPACVAQNRRHRRILRGQVRIVAWKPAGVLRYRSKSILMMVAPRKQTGTRRRAKRRCVPLRIGEPIVGESLQSGHIDPAAVRRPSGATGIVVQDHKNIWRIFRRFVRKKCRPIRFGVADVEIDGSLEWLHYVFLLNVTL